MLNHDFFWGVDVFFEGKSTRNNFFPSNVQVSCKFCQNHLRDRQASTGGAGQVPAPEEGTFGGCKRACTWTKNFWWRNLWQSYIYIYTPSIAIFFSEQLLMSIGIHLDVSSDLPMIFQGGWGEIFSPPAQKRGPKKVPKCPRDRRLVFGHKICRAIHMRNHVCSKL